MKTGIQLIQEERERQISKKGWTSEHDDTHSDDSLACAAAVYALPHRVRNWKLVGTIACLASALWPFDLSNFKP